MASKKNKTYDRIERPYGVHLERDGEYNINTGGELSADGGAVDGSGTINPTGGGEVAGTPVKSEQSFDDIWITNKIRSKSWKPQQSGFMIDGERGYAEFSDVFISGAITVIVGGTIGGWSISADELSKGNVHLKSTAEQILMGSATAPLTGTGIFIGNDGGTYELRAGNPAGAYIHWDGSTLTVNGALISSLSSGTEIAIQGWVHDMVFSFSDADTVAWGAGTITLMNGVTYSIDAGNTGNMAAETFIYLDIGTSTTVLQTTTTKVDSMGTGKILVAIAEDATDEAEFFVFGSRDSNLNAANIRANSITANEVAANTITATEINVSQLSAITADLGAITAGTIVLPTSGLIRSGQASYDSGTGFYLGNDGGTPKFSIGNSAANRLTWDGATLTIIGTVSGTITADDLTGTVPADTLGTYTNDWVFDGTWTLTDLNTVTWGSGTLTLSDSTTYSITGAGTGNMAAKTFIYLDIGTSTTAFQVTTTRATAVGTGKLLIAIAENGASEPSLVVLNSDSFNIDASNIVAGSITANEITAGTITATEMTISTLSAITADMGSITAGDIVLPLGGFIRSGQASYDSGTGFYLGNDGGTPKFSIGNSAANKLTWDGSTLTIVGTVSGSIAAGDLTGTIAAGALDTFTNEWTYSGTWTLTDADTVTWGAGTLTLSNGDTYSVAGGNTGNMTTKEYIYWDITVSSGLVFTSSTTKTDAVGAGKLLIAIAEDGSVEPSLIVVNDDTFNIDASNIVAGSITATEITAGTITGTEISASAIITAGTGNNVGVLDGNDATYRIYAGNATPANAPFSVTQAGIVHAEDIVLGNRFVTVAPGDSIQDAIDLVASGGGVVVLRNGTHTQSAHIVLPSNVYLQGQNAEAAIIDFNSTANQIQIIGSNSYTTGTLSISNGSTTVTGVSTVWISAMIGRRILLGGLWYVIVARASNTSITISAPFGGETVASGTSYTIATVVADVKISDLTIKGSNLSAIHGQYVQEFFLSDLNIQTSATGVEIDTSSNLEIRDLDLAANFAGFDFDDVHFLAITSSGTLDDLVGNGLTINGVTGLYLDGCFFLNSAGDGINVTNSSNLIFSGVGVFTSGGQGWEFVSGNDDIALLGCGARGCASDGIKLTATTDGLKITSCVLKDNGGYGVNIAASTNDGTIIGSSTFKDNSSGAINDLGTDTTVRNNFGVVDNTGIIKFGGDGSDGALTITSGTTTISASSGKILEKNYTTISITSSGKLAFSTPHTSGTIILVRSQGAVTLTASATVIDASAMGGAGGSGASESTAFTTGNGNSGSDGSTPFWGVDKGDAANAGTGGLGGAISSKTASSYISIALHEILSQYPFLVPGAGGGAGAVRNQAGTTTSGPGGAGGGALLIECGGAWNFTTSNGISVAGEGGSSGTASSDGKWGGSGGGAGGVCAVYYNNLVADSGTIVVSAGGGQVGDFVGAPGSTAIGGGGGGGSVLNTGTTGTDGTGANEGGDAGGGGAGTSLTSLNTRYA